MTAGSKMFNPHRWSIDALPGSNQGVATCADECWAAKIKRLVRCTLRRDATVQFKQCSFFIALYVIDRSKLFVNASIINKHALQDSSSCICMLKIPLTVNVVRFWLAGGMGFCSICTSAGILEMILLCICGHHTFIPSIDSWVHALPHQLYDESKDVFLFLVDSKVIFSKSNGVPKHKNSNS